VGRQSVKVRAAQLRSKLFKPRFNKLLFILIALNLKLILCLRKICKRIHAATDSAPAAAHKEGGNYFVLSPITLFPPAD
jgi:hypothetical protein